MKRKVGKQQEQEALELPNFFWISLAFGFAFSNLLCCSSGNWVESQKQSQRRASILCQLVGANLFWRFLSFPYLFFVNNHRFRSHYFMAYKTVGWSSSKKTIKKKKTKWLGWVCHCQFHDFGSSNWPNFSYFNHTCIDFWACLFVFRQSRKLPESLVSRQKFRMHRHISDLPSSCHITPQTVIRESWSKRQ
jgi:hypothetical protein